MNAKRLSCLLMLKRGHNWPGHHGHNVDQPSVGPKLDPATGRKMRLQQNPVMGNLGTVFFACREFWSQCSEKKSRTHSAHSRPIFSSAQVLEDPLQQRLSTA